MNTRRRPVTEGQLAQLVLQANINAGTPLAHHVQGKAQVGHYCLSYAYGGVALHQIKSEGGSVRDVFGMGHMTKRELFHLLWSWAPPEAGQVRSATPEVAA